MVVDLPPRPANVPPKGLLFGTFLQVSGQACEYCLHAPEPDEKFERCSKCRRVYYCDEACQGQDWDSHKALCKGLRRVNTAEASEALPNGKLTPEEYGERMKARMAILTAAEQDPIYVQNAIKCEVCLLTPFQKDEFSTFHRCKRCELAWYCSPECKSSLEAAHTRQQCDALFELHCTERFNLDYTLRRRQIRTINFITPQPRRTYRRLSSLTGWDSYFEHHFPEYNIWTTNGASEFAAGNKDPKAAVTALTKEALVFPLTIATALETALPDVASRTSLVIHVVGADTRELLSQATLENILHCYPRLRSLKLCFIGPNADPHPYPRNVACGECIDQRRRREVLYAPVKYHDSPWAPCKVHPSRPNAPDFIVCFNTGMLESDAATDSWAETIQVILDADVPALFTTTTRADAFKEVAKFRAERARFILKARKNRWHGPLHIPNVYRAEELMEGGPQTTAYNSHYLYMVQGRVDS
ncbi:hypothetical protein PENSPDRAFT_733551 [Peniophora sp. CONT]|nr:hypothetical protein PENSPDRAFT_733551 [Peniophora sp. CONT]